MVANMNNNTLANHEKNALNMDDTGGSQIPVINVAMYFHYHTTC